MLVSSRLGFDNMRLCAYIDNDISEENAAPIHTYTKKKQNTG